MQPIIATKTTVILLACAMLGAIALSLPLPDGLSETARRTAVIAAVMAALWMTETIPIPVTALLPLIAFPLLGVLGFDATARPYADPLIFLFLGGFMLAAAMQRWDLHRLLAKRVVAIAGPHPAYQVLAMMCGTAFLSLWISNTAAAMVMLPIGLSMIATRTDAEGEGEGKTDGVIGERPIGDSYGPALMLGIAFSATIGGMGSLIGTPPNALFAGFVERSYGISIGFGQWMLLGMPIVVLLIPITWLLLTRVVFAVPNAARRSEETSFEQTTLSFGQIVVALVLVLTALAWIARPLIEATSGLSGLSDAGIALIAVVALFVLRDGSGTNQPLLCWDDVKAIRWDVLILFGGGLALAEGIGTSGLAQWIGALAGSLHALPILVLVLAMMVAIVYLGELASNTAMAAIFLPIAGAAAVGLGIDPLTLTLPVALAASLGFMLPVATPPNAIVYGSGAVEARHMLKAGALLNIISIAIVFVIAVTLGPAVLRLSAGVGG